MWKTKERKEKEKIKDKRRKKKKNRNKSEKTNTRMAAALDHRMESCSSPEVTEVSQELDHDIMENGGNLFDPENDVDMDLPNINSKVSLYMYVQRYPHLSRLMTNP